MGEEPANTCTSGVDAGWGFLKQVMHALQRLGALILPPQHWPCLTAAAATQARPRKTA